MYCAAYPDVSSKKNPVFRMSWQVNCFNFELSCASIIAIVSNTGGLEYPKSYILCYVNGQHQHSASLTTTLNHEGFLKLKVAMARLFTSFQMQICRPRQRRHRDPRPRLGGYGDAGGGGGGSSSSGGGGGDATAPAQLLCALLRRPLRLRAAAAAPPPRIRR
jgi:uncharacterized membrane protein YgcG